MSRSSHPAAAAQESTSAPPSSCSGTYAATVIDDDPMAYRHESLLGADIAHWSVIGSVRRGYWRVLCRSCDRVSDVRIDERQGWIPRCRHCGARAPKGTTLASERARHFVRQPRAKHLTGKR